MMVVSLILRPRTGPGKEGNNYETTQIHAVCAVQFAGHPDIFPPLTGVLFLGQYTGGWTTTHLFSVYCSSLKDPLFTSGSSAMCWATAAGTIS
mgnify:CR=1 FL=1